MERVEIGDAVLYLGDCLEVLPTLEAGSVDAVVTDPPYGKGAYQTDIAVTDTLLRLRPIGRTLAIFGYPEMLIGQCVSAQMQPDEWVTWWPTNKQTARGNSRLPKECETVAIFGPTPGATRIVRPRVQNKFTLPIHEKRGNSTDWARDGDVWRDPSPGMGFFASRRLHPNEKPITVMSRLVLLCTDDGAIILDPFMGSGTTGVACAQLGRKFIGIEIEPRYFEIACRRIEAAQAQMRLPL